MKILVLPGDGIGPEITHATLAVLDRVNARFTLGLEWLATRHARPEFGQAATAIEAAIDTSLKTVETRTSDLGGKLGTRAFTAEVVSRL